MNQQHLLRTLLMLIAVLSVLVSGCSFFSRPSDDEVIKAINESGLLTSEAFTITAPLKVVDRGGQNKDGSWTFRVRMTMTMKLPNGTLSAPKENTSYFTLVKVGKDSAGKDVWKARLGS